MGGIFTLTEPPPLVLLLNAHIAPALLHPKKAPLVLSGYDTISMPSVTDGVNHLIPSDKMAVTLPGLHTNQR